MESREEQTACCSKQPSSKIENTAEASSVSRDGCSMRVQYQQQHAAAGGRPTPGRRRVGHWRSGLLGIVLLAAVLQPGCCAELESGDAQDRAFEDLTMLARAGQIITGAVADTAAAISSGTNLPSNGGSNAQVLL